MSKLLKKLKPGVRIIDIESGKEGYVFEKYRTDIVVRFYCDDDIATGTIYPNSIIKNRIKLAPKYGNYKVGDRVKITDKIEDYVSNCVNAEGVVEEIVEDVLIVKIGIGWDYCHKNFTRSGRLVENDYYSNKPVLKKLKVKKPE